MPNKNVQQDNNTSQRGFASMSEENVKKITNESGKASGEKRENE